MRGENSGGCRRGAKQDSRVCEKRNSVDKKKNKNKGGVGLGYRGCKFTWQNNRFSGGLTIERLDRVVVSGNWITTFPVAMVSNAPIIVSDHGYILLDSSAGKQRGVKPFRFFEAWARERSYQETIKRVTQPWIPWLDYDEFTELMNRVKPRYPHISSVADMSNPNGSWNIELLKEMFGDVLGERIGKINRLPHDNSDLVVWKEASDGRFTVKSGYEATFGGSSHEDGILLKKVWSKNVHYRHSVMIWRAIMGCVPTRDRLEFVGDKSCRLCDGAIESALHIFWECHCARALWFSSPFPISYGTGNDADDIAQRRNVLRSPAAADGRVLCNSTDTHLGRRVRWVLLDRRNNSSFWYAKYDQASSAAEAEIMAIKWALELAEQKGFQSFAGASDAKVLINALNVRQCPPMWTLKPLSMEVISKTEKTVISENSPNEIGGKYENVVGKPTIVGHGCSSSSSESPK
ncbi:hypothetical protein F8388_013136 [Cannabis sativa]|uniref:RNase H type-1 domain-containing protein n=1 Tax=Cannabis sativa TaxID=3483 RepID=A0A7J6HL51_CANSA|nr:hypothetical protein F8388_013136 [Cannabis sativa]